MEKIKFLEVCPKKLKEVYHLILYPGDYEEFLDASTEHVAKLIRKEIDKYEDRIKKFKTVSFPHTQRDITLMNEFSSLSFDYIGEWSNEKFKEEVETRTGWYKESNAQLESFLKEAKIESLVEKPKTVKVESLAEKPKTVKVENLAEKPKTGKKQGSENFSEPLKKTPSPAPFYKDFSLIKKWFGKFFRTTRENDKKKG